VLVWTVGRIPACISVHTASFSPLEELWIHPLTKGCVCQHITPTQVTSGFSSYMLIWSFQSELKGYQQKIHFPWPFSLHFSYNVHEKRHDIIEQILSAVAHLYINTWWNPCTLMCAHYVYQNVIWVLSLILQQPWLEYYVNTSLSSVERWCLSKGFNQKFPPWIPKRAAAGHIWSPLLRSANPYSTMCEWSRLFITGMLDTSMINAVSLIVNYLSEANYFLGFGIYTFWNFCN